MVAADTSKRNSAHRAVAISLTMWLSGLLCVFGCVPGVSAAPVKSEELTQSAVETNDGATVVSAPGHACCRALNKVCDAVAVESLSDPPDAMRCCPFAGETSDAARKSRLKDETGFTAAAVVRHLSAKTAGAATNAGRRARLPDRRETYLRCCVFLI